MAAYELAPQGLFNSSFNVSQNGVVVATICGSVWRNRAALNAQGCECEAYGTGFPRNTFLLTANLKPCAQAARQGAFRRSFVIEHQGESYRLQPEHWWSGDFIVRQNDREIAAIRCRGFFGRKADVYFPDEWPVYLQLFTIWLVTVQWSYDASS